MHLNTQPLLRHASFTHTQAFFICPRCKLRCLFCADRNSPDKSSPRRSGTPSSNKAHPSPFSSPPHPPPPSNNKSNNKPTLNNALIIVEGMSDKHAVLRAVNADIFVLNSATKSTNTHVITQLQDLLASRPNTAVVILTDPDVAGRQARNALNNTFNSSCWHAFIPTIAATAQLDVRQKQAGDIGVEHASVEAIRWALKQARKSSLGRSEFTKDFIQSLGLVSSYDASLPAGDAAKRRFLVCNYMGLGECNGKQLLRQLNDYGFTKDDLAEALTWAEERIVTDQG